MGVGFDVFEEEFFLVDYLFIKFDNVVLMLYIGVLIVEV